MSTNKVGGTAGRRRDVEGTVSSTQLRTGGQPCGVIHRLSTGKHELLEVGKVDGTGGRTLWGRPVDFVPSTWEMGKKLSTGDWYGR